MSEKKKRGNSPWIPPAVPVPVTMAIKGLYAGTATPEQQQQALEWIIQHLCATHDQQFYLGADGQRETDFALGKRFVGLQLIREIKIPNSLLRRDDK